MKLRTFSSPEKLQSLRRGSELLRWVPGNPFDHRPDRHLVLVDGNEAVACCSIWWRETPLCDGVPSGAIGHFFAPDGDAAGQLLEAAVSRLAGTGVGAVVGPMDGNTWRRYRLITRRGGDPLFFLEPDNPPEWPEWFGSAGFAPAARYTSALMEAPPAPDDRLPRALRRLENAGVRIRNLDPSSFGNELKRIHEVSSISFRDNFLYTPLSEELFLTQYQKIEPIVRAELVLIAERAGRPVGFAFAIPDMLERAPQQTAVLKTLAVLPGREYAGLGALLAGLVRQRAAKLGFSRLIHALMHESNNSRNLAREGARTFREYTLYQKKL